MKQHITIEQLNELKDTPGDPPINSLSKYWEWMDKKGYSLSISRHGVSNLMTIGQMIEFLRDKGQNVIYWLDKKPEQLHQPELWCDALWEAVKEILND